MRLTSAILSVGFCQGYKGRKPPAPPSTAKTLPQALLLPRATVSRPGPAQRFIFIPCG